MAAQPRSAPNAHLACAGATNVDDDDLVIVLAHPDVLADVVIRHRILATIELDDRQVLSHTTRDAEDRRDRLGW